LENQKIYCVSCYSVENLGNVGDALDLDNSTINRFDELRKLYLLVYFKKNQKMVYYCYSPLDNFKKLASKLLEELLRFLRKSNTDWSGVIDTNIITPLLKMPMTPRLRTLDLTVIKKLCNSDISIIVYLAELSPVIFKKDTHQEYF
jgi:hypothetical protein